MPATGIIFGAGSVGRGFLGQLLCESGYEVVFVDIDRQLVDELLRRGYYRLCLSSNDGIEDLHIGPVRAVYALDIDRVATEVAQAGIIVTAVGGRELASIAPPIASGLVERWATGDTSPLNLIICENLPNAPAVLFEFLIAALPERFRRDLRQRVGFVPAVVARMSPTPTREQRAADITLIVAEPYKLLPVDRQAFVGEIPDVVGMLPVSPFAAYVQRKLYIHNAGHAVLGYLGYKCGHLYAHTALNDPWVRPRLESGLNEGARAVYQEHGLESRELQQHVRDLLKRFSNRALADPIGRLCRDPVRKLAPGDRLVGAARLAEKHAIRPIGLSWGIAAALAYDDPSDSHAVELQARLSERGLPDVLHDVCRINQDEPLSDLVSECYCQLQQL